MTASETRERTADREREGEGERESDSIAMMRRTLRTAGAVRWHRSCRRLSSNVAAVLKSRAVIEIR